MCDYHYNYINDNGNNMKNSNKMSMLSYVLSVCVSLHFMWVSELDIDSHSFFV